MSVFDLFVPANQGLVPDFMFAYLLSGLFPKPLFNVLSE